MAETEKPSKNGPEFNVIDIDYAAEMTGVRIDGHQVKCIQEITINSRVDDLVEVTLRFKAKKLDYREDFDRLRQRQFESRE